jgi:K+-sensing histidine kinase KdpD
LSIRDGGGKQRGGHLQAANAAQGGALFTLELPLHRAPAGGEAEARDAG